MARIQWHLVFVILLVLQNAIPPTSNGPTPVETATTQDTVASSPVALKDGTALHFRLGQTISSELSKPGDEVLLEMEDDLWVDNNLVIPSGAVAMATVSSVKPKRHNGKGGELLIEFKYVTISTGEKVPIRSARAANGLAETKFNGRENPELKQNAAAPVLAAPFAPYLFLLTGRDVTLIKGTPVIAYFDGDFIPDADKLHRANFVFSRDNPSNPPETETPAATVDRLEKGTKIKLRTTELVSSLTASVNDPVAFEVAEDVMAGSMVVIPRGSIASGVVAMVRHKGALGHGGQLSIQIKDVPTITGEKVALTGQEKQKGSSGGFALDVADSVGTSIDPKNAPLFLPVAAPILVPIALMDKGLDVIIPRGTTTEAYTDTELPLQLGRLQAANNALIQARGMARARTETLDPVVYLYRPAIHYGSALKISVLLDNVELTKLDTARYLGIRLSPGKHVFQTTDKKPQELDLHNGQQYFVRAEWGTWHPHLAVVSAEVAEREIYDPNQPFAPVEANTIKTQAGGQLVFDPPKAR